MDKFAIRDIAEKILKDTVANSEDRIAPAISKAAKANALSDVEVMELIKQVNVVNQYNNFKQAGFTMGEETLANAPKVLNPKKLFEAVAKTAAFKGSFSLPEEKWFSTNRKRRNIPEVFDKTASINTTNTESRIRKQAQLLTKLVDTVKKQASLSNIATIIEARESITHELRMEKKAFFEQVAALTDIVKPYPTLRKKYAKIILTDEFYTSKPYPTAKDVVAIKSILKKMAQIKNRIDTLTTLNNIVKGG